MMKKLCKTKLINLTKKYISVPNNKSKISYEYYYGTSKISFFKCENNNYYHIKVEFTYFCGDFVLNIEQENCFDKNDYKRKFIKLGSNFPEL